MDEKVVIHIEVKDCIQDCPFAELELENIEYKLTWFCNRISSECLSHSYLITHGPNLSIVTPLKSCPFRKENM